MNLVTKQLIAHLDPQWREYFEERAGILEFDCKLPREEAENLSFRETTSAILKAKVMKMAEQQKSKPQHLHIRKTADTASLAAGEDCK